jgi:hypothetical protein
MTLSRLLAFAVISVGIVLVFLVIPLVLQPEGEELRSLKGNLIHEFKRQMCVKGDSGPEEVARKKEIIRRTTEGSVDEPLVYRGATLFWSWPPRGGGRILLRDARGDPLSEPVPQRFIAYSAEPVHFGKRLFLFIDAGRLRVVLAWDSEISWEYQCMKSDIEQVEGGKKANVSNNGK